MQNFIFFIVISAFILTFINTFAATPTDIQTSTPPLIKNQNLFAANSSYEVCFTPDQNCTQDIINLINSAQTQIRMQIYSFTSKPIARALVQAQKRGVDVQVIYDRSDASDESSANARSDYKKYPYSGFSLQPYLTKNHIAGFIDPAVGIAHNKVIIVDSQMIETGSFNYTKSAQINNAENILIINSKPLAQAYLSNWDARRKISTALN